MDQVPLPLFLVSVAATVIGPLAAVLITYWLQRRDRDYQRRFAVFQTLMRTRRNWLNQEWVGSLNLIPVEYHQFPLVVESFGKVLDRYSDPAWQGSEPQRQRIYENTETAVSELLHRMAKALRVELQGLDLRNRAYSPTGWGTDEEKARRIRELVEQLLSGMRPLAVTPFIDPNVASPSPEPKSSATEPTPPQSPDPK